MPRLKKMPELEKWIKEMNFYCLEIKGQVASRFVIITSSSPELAKKNVERKFIDYKVTYIGKISESIIEA